MLFVYLGKVKEIQILFYAKLQYARPYGIENANGGRFPSAKIKRVACQNKTGRCSVAAATHAVFYYSADPSGCQMLYFIIQRIRVDAR